MVEILHNLLHNIYDCNLDHLENLIMEGVTNAFTDTLSECFFFSSFLDYCFLFYLSDGLVLSIYCIILLF